MYTVLVSLLNIQKAMDLRLAIPSVLYKRVKYTRINLNPQ